MMRVRKSEKLNLLQDNHVKLLLQLAIALVLSPTIYKTNKTVPILSLHFYVTCILYPSAVCRGLITCISIY